MQDKELEKILQEKAEKTEMREFFQVWEEIKDEVVSEKKEKKNIFKNKFFLAFAPAVLVICIVLTPLLFFNPTRPQEKIYFTEELISTLVTEKEMFDGLSTASIAHVDLNEYIIVDPYLFLTENTEAKGAHLEFYNENPTTFIAKMELCDKSVDLKINTSLYDTNCKVNSADLYYKFKSAESGFYEYSIYATCNNVQYVIEYSGVTDNVMEFLNEFFA